MTDENNTRSRKRLKVDEENDQSAESDTNGPHQLTLPMVYDKCQEVLENQKNFNTEVVDKLRSVESELQSIRDELKPKIVKAAAPVKADSNNTTACNSENKRDNTMSTTGKYFVLKYVFKNVSSMKEDEKLWSETEEHYAVNWKMLVIRRKHHLSFHLSCGTLTDIKNWSIEVQWKQVFLSKSTETENHCVEANATLSDPFHCTKGFDDFLEWTTETEEAFIVNDQVTAEIHVKIKKTTGIYKENLRNFDETMEEVSDVVLVVNKEKFYVSKLYLATHSPYFKALFLGNFDESKKLEIELDGIDPADFQKYLEVLYAESAIDEFTVEGILMVADMYDTPLVIQKCKDFLLEKSDKSLKKKLELSTRYHFEELKEQCLDKIESVADIQSVMPVDVCELEPSIMRELLKKSLAIHNPE